MVERSVMPGNPVPTRRFGSTGQEVTIVGLGGEGVLRTYGQERAATEVIQEALARGITYCDSARAYSGSENYYGTVWRQKPDLRGGIFQTSKSAMRRKDQALAELDQTLANMNTDHLDLWQIHDVRTQQDFDAIEGPGGALEGFLEAKQTGKVRFIGVTGHHDFRILSRAVREWPVDSVLLPVNPVEVLLGGFLDDTLAAARERGIAVVGMKVLGGSHYLFPEAGLDARTLIRFALSQSITLAVVGCATPGEVETLTRTAAGFEPLTGEEQTRILEQYRPHARRLAYYRGVL